MVSICDTKSVRRLLQEAGGEAMMDHEGYFAKMNIE
jgi:hypothetical protein